MRAVYYTDGVFDIWALKKVQRELLQLMSLEKDQSLTMVEMVAIALQ